MQGPVFLGKAKQRAALRRIGKTVQRAVLRHGVFRGDPAVLKKHAALVTSDLLKIVIEAGNEAWAVSDIRHDPAPVCREAVDLGRKIAVVDPLIQYGPDLRHAVGQMNQRLRRLQQVRNRSDVRIDVI